MKKSLVLIGLMITLSFTTLKAQVALAYYPWQSELSISTNTDRTLFLELRTATNTFWGNVTTEAIAHVSVKHAEKVNYTLGAGTSLGLFADPNATSIMSGYSLHFGSRIRPFEKYHGVQLLFEISPFASRYLDAGLLRTRLGVGYQF